MNANVSLQEVTVRETASGIPMITMCLPEGWTAEVTADRKTYNGFGEPMRVTLECSSPDRQSLISYLSNVHYCDRHGSSCADFSTDLQGRLFRKFLPVESFLKCTAEARLSANDKVRFRHYQDRPENEAWEKNYRKWILEQNRDPLTAVDGFYYRGGTVEYSFCARNGKACRCVSSAIVEGADYTVERPLPPEIAGMLGNPLSGDIGRMAAGGYRNVRFDEKTGIWVHTADAYRDWYVSQKILMIMPEARYEDQYRRIYLPLISFGAHYTPELQKEMDSLQASINRHNHQVLESASINQSPSPTHKEDEEQRRQRDRQARETLRKTQTETAAIQRSMYENRQKSEAKVREMRNDTMMGNTRYTDRYGTEHVLHTTDRYAYRNGDTYLSGNSPLDPGYGWEELEKKKY